MTELADIHCHILPYVDDGAEHLEEMEELLSEQARQGVRVVCATPHLREGMFNASDEEIRQQYRRARSYVREQRLPIYLCLSREYYCDKRFLALVEEGRVLPMGREKTLLVEFSGRHSAETIVRSLEKVMGAGYRPLAAHVERYPAVQAEPELVQRMRELGAKIQMNAGSVLGREGWRQKRLSWELLRRGMVDVVASDAHGPQHRPVELGECAHKIEHKLGEAYARKVLWETPLQIVSP